MTEEGNKGPVILRLSDHRAAHQTFEAVTNSLIICLRLMLTEE